MSDSTEAKEASAWEQGKAEARKRFGKRDSKPAPTDTNDSEQPSEQHTGTAAGIAEARRRFGTRTK